MSKLTATSKCCRCQSDPTHNDDCITARGRRISRVCSDCGERFALYSSRSNRRRCSACLDARSDARDTKLAQAQNMSLREYRIAQHEATRHLTRDEVSHAIQIRAAVQHAICCRACGAVLDQSFALVYKLRAGSNAAVACCSCGDRLKGQIDIVTVLDSRWVPPSAWKKSDAALVAEALRAEVTR